MPSETINFNLLQQSIYTGLFHTINVEAVIDTDTNQITSTIYTAGGQQFTPTDQAVIDDLEGRINYVRQRKTDLGGTLPEADAAPLPEEEVEA